MSSRVYLFFPPRGHEPPPTLRDRFNPHLCLQRRRFPIPRYAKRPDVALYAVGPLFLLPTPSSPHRTLKVSQYDSLWQPPAAHPDERPSSTKAFSCATSAQCPHAGLSRGHGCTTSSDGLVACALYLSFHPSRNPMTWYMIYRCNIIRYQWYQNIKQFHSRSNKTSKNVPYMCII